MDVRWFALAASGALAVAEASELEVRSGRFRTTVRAAPAEAAEALSRALTAANTLLEDARFIDLVLEQDDLRASCGDASLRVDPAPFIDAFVRDPLLEVARPWRFTTLERLERRRFWGNSSTGDKRVRIRRGHPGIAKPASGVRGSLLNTVVHELTHLGRGATANSFWVADGCGLRPRGSDAFQAFRPSAASYRIGNIGQCFAWASSQNGCDWRGAYDECMAAGIDVFGVSEHAPSAEADLPLVPARCAHQEAASTPRDEDPTTVVHRLLQQHAAFVHGCAGEDADGWLRERTNRLDGLLSAVDARLAHEGVNLGVDAPDESIREALELVDRTLYEEGYVTCTVVSTFEETLGSSYRIEATANTIPMREGRCHIHRDQPYRAAAVQAHAASGLHPFDCDLGSLLYLAVAERRGWPLRMVEVPGHNFIRWRRPDGTYLNWDTNAATSYTDDEYRAGRTATWTRGIGDGRERARFLEDLSGSEVEGYYLGLLVSRIPTSECIDRAHRQLTGDQRASALNNFAWAYATRSFYDGTAAGQTALVLAESATLAEPTCEYWDTLSCALAAAGELERAIEVEREHVPGAPRQAFYASGRTCYEPAVANAGSCP